MHRARSNRSRRGQPPTARRHPRLAPTQQSNAGDTGLRIASGGWSDRSTSGYSSDSDSSDDDSYYSPHDEFGGWVDHPDAYTNDEDEDNDNNGEDEEDLDAEQDRASVFGALRLMAELMNARRTPRRQQQRQQTERAPASRPRPQTPLAPPPPALCRFFVLGKCKFGSRCTYSHTVPTVATGQAQDEEVLAQVAVTMVDCPYFQRGNCRFGDYCRLRHAVPADNQVEVNHTQAPPATGTPPTATSTSTSTGTTGDNQTQDHTCGICFDDVVEAGKHFGLLNCDHCFCLDCLRAWRQSKDMEVDVTRACPACREPSNFIVPSLKFCTGAAKEELVDAYKRHLAIRECKYFDGSYGSCPFGHNCFYAHRNALGEDVKHLDVPRKRAQRRRSALSAEEALTRMFGDVAGLQEFFEELDWY